MVSLYLALGIVQPFSFYLGSSAALGTRIVPYDDSAAKQQRLEEILLQLNAKQYEFDKVLLQAIQDDKQVIHFTTGAGANALDTCELLILTSYRWRRQK